MLIIFTNAKIMPFPWYLHAAANIYQRRNTIAKSITGYYTYRTARKTMGYLRGSNKIVPYSSYSMRPYSSSKPTTRLATELMSIHRKLNKQRPETKHWFSAALSYQAAANVTTRADYNLTQQFHSDPAFRDNVLGDKWRNLSLHIRLNSFNSGFLGQCRIIVYKPKRAGTTWPGLSVLSHVDPGDHIVYLDRMVPFIWQGFNNTTEGKIAGSYICSLRNTITCFDTAVRSGEIRVAILIENDQADPQTIDVRYMLKYQNV